MPSSNLDLSIQKRLFVNWINYKLSQNPEDAREIEDLHCLSNVDNVTRLAQVLLGNDDELFKVREGDKVLPLQRLHKIFEYFAKQTREFASSPEDLYNYNEDKVMSVCEFVWILILNYHLLVATTKLNAYSDLTPNRKILSWLKDRVGVDCDNNNLMKQWKEGELYAKLTNTFCPGFISDEELAERSAIELIGKALSVSKDIVGIELRLDPEDIIQYRNEDLSVFLSFYILSGARDDGDSFRLEVSDTRMESSLMYRLCVKIKNNKYSSHGPQFYAEDKDENKFNSFVSQVEKDVYDIIFVLEGGKEYGIYMDLNDKRHFLCEAKAVGGGDLRNISVEEQERYSRMDDRLKELELEEREKDDELKRLNEDYSKAKGDFESQESKLKGQMMELMNQNQSLYSFSDQCEELRKKESQLDSDLSYLTKTLQEKNDEIRCIQEEKAQTIKEYDERSKEFDRIRDSLKEEIEELKQKVAKYSQNLYECSKNQENRVNSEEFDKMSDELQKLNLKFGELNKNFNLLLNKLRNFDNFTDSIFSSLGIDDSAMNDLESEEPQNSSFEFNLTLDKSRFKKIKMHVETLEKIKQELTERLEDITKENKNNEMLLTDFDTRLKLFAKNNSQLVKDYDDTRNQLEKLRAEKNELQDSFNKVNLERDQCQSDLEKVDSQRMECQKNFETKDEECRACSEEAKSKNDQYQSDLVLLKSERDELKKDLLFSGMEGDQLKNNLETMGAEKKELGGELKKNKSHFQDILDEVTLERDKLKYELDVINSRYDQLQKSLKKQDHTKGGCIIT